MLKVPVKYKNALDGIKFVDLFCGIGNSISVNVLQYITKEIIDQYFSR